MPRLSRIVLFPIKSLDGVFVQQARIAPGGSLVGDREFAIADACDRWVNGKRVPKIMGLRASFDLPQRQVILRTSGDLQSHRFHLDQERTELEHWLSAYFEQPVHLVQNLETGFPDDRALPGPTVVSEASLCTVASWYPELDVDSMRRRFRTNLEVDDAEPFWEDYLFGETQEEPVRFQIGDVQCLGVNPCQRCPVPTRDPETGEPYDRFQRIFQDQRRLTLPEGVARSRFNHFYRLTVNTTIPASEAGKQLQVGDGVTLG